VKRNKKVENFLLGLLGVALAILSVYLIPAVFVGAVLVVSLVIDKGNEIGFPWATVFITLVVIAAFINTIQNELKRKNLKPTFKNIITEVSPLSFAWVSGILIIALGVYLISLWPPLLFFIFATAFFGSYIPLAKDVFRTIKNKRKKKK